MKYTDFVSEIKRQSTDTKFILVTFCISESVALVMPSVANDFTKPNPSRGILNRCPDKRRAKENGIEIYQKIR